MLEQFDVPAKGAEASSVSAASLSDGSLADRVVGLFATQVVAATCAAITIPCYGCLTCFLTSFLVAPAIYCVASCLFD